MIDDWKLKIPAIMIEVKLPYGEKSLSLYRDPGDRNIGTFNFLLWVFLHFKVFTLSVKFFNSKPVTKCSEYRLIRSSKHKLSALNNGSKTWHIYNICEYNLMTPIMLQLHTHKQFLY